MIKKTAANQLNGDAIVDLNVSDALKDELQLLEAADLAKLLHRSTKYVKKDASQRPETLPPRFQVPGTRKLLWRLKDVRIWMDAHSAKKR